MRVRKKPVEVEAVQLRWDTWSEMCEFAGVGRIADGKPEGCYADKASGKLFDGALPQNLEQHTALCLQIPTLEGVMLATEGDWIIRGINGELYPCKPDIFEKTYEILQ